MTAASFGSDGTIAGGMRDAVSGPADTGELRMTDKEPATQLGIGEAVSNLLNPTRGRPGTADSLTADTGTTDFDTTEPADADAPASAAPAHSSAAASSLGEMRAPASVRSGSTRTPADGSEVVSALNALLRGEISAAETYRNALEKIADGDHADHAGLLREIQKEHGRACQSLRDRIRELGGEATDSSGAWGAWSQIVQGTMGLFGGDKGAVKALKEGEEHGLRDYDDSVPKADPTTAQLIQNQLIPLQRRHIALLDQIIAAV